MTDSEGFEKMQEIALSVAAERNLQGVVLFPRVGVSPANFFDYYDEQGHSVCFGFEYIFWNENAPYVKMFMKVLEIADKNGVKWQFLRIACVLRWGCRQLLRGLYLWGSPRLPSN